MKRFLKWALVVAGVLIAGAVGTAAVAKYNSLQERYGWFVKSLNEIQGVKIGDSQQELQYAYGNPSGKFSPTDSSSAAPIEPGSNYFTHVQRDRAESLIQWDWFIGNTTITAQFDSSSKTVMQISCFYVSGDNNVCNTLGADLGQSKYRTEDHIKCRLGDPDRAEYQTVNNGSADIKRKTLFYDTLGISYVLQGREAFGVTKRKTETPGFLWWLQQYKDGQNC